MKLLTKVFQKALTCFLAISMLFNPNAVFVALAQEVGSFVISPINEDSFVSGDVTVSATITDAESPITRVSFTITDYDINEESCEGEQSGDDGSNWSCQIDTRGFDDSNDGLYDATIDYEDENGNSNTSYYSDNNDYFNIDNTSPNDPFVGSSSHNVDEFSPNNTIDIFLEGGDDNGSGIDGFSYSFTQNEEDLPDENKDIEEDVANLSSEELSDGTWYFHLRTVDNVNNWTSTVHAGPFIIDATGPSAPTASPLPGDYNGVQEVFLSSSDEGSGLSGIYYTTDGSEPSKETGTLFEGPIIVNKSMTIKAIAYDNVGNTSLVSQLAYGIAPQISEETSANPTTTSITVNWSTDNPSTSRIIYDTISHTTLGAPPNYGYANSTVEGDISPKVTSHSVVLTGLNEGTTYYYRTISKGSPESVGSEKSFTTQPSSPSPSQSSSSNGGGTSSTGSTASAPVCSDQKPESAPTLLTAKASENSVTLRWSKGLEPVSYYLVAYGLTPGALQFGNPNVGGNDTTSFTVQNLSGGTTYYFRVRAGNGCMPGDYSNELSATPQGSYVVGSAVEFDEGVLGAQTSVVDTHTPTVDTHTTPPDTVEVTPSQPDFNLTQTIKNFLASVLSFITGFFGR